MTVSRILHQCTKGIYRDFFYQSPSQKVLKVALPFMGLLVLGAGSIALARFLRRQFASTSGSSKSPVLNDFPKNLYNGVVLPTHPDLLLQAHRWGNKTNLDTLVLLSHGKAYPANRFSLAHSSYIMAESPLNNGIVNWQKDYYRMAIETNAELLISVASPFKARDINQLDTEQFHFLINANPLEIDSFTLKCFSIEQISPLYYAYELRIFKNSLPYNTIWQLLPREAPGGSFKEIQDVISMVNAFIKEKKLMHDHPHPLLVNCRTGIDRTGRFVLFHNLQQKLEVFITEKLKITQNDQEILELIVGNRDICEMLIEEALIIESLSTKTAAIDAIRSTVLPRFNGELGCTPVTVNTLYKEHVLETIQKMRAMSSHPPK